MKAAFIRSTSPIRYTQMRKLNPVWWSGMLSMTVSYAAIASWYCPSWTKAFPMFRMILKRISRDELGTWSSAIRSILMEEGYFFCS